MPPAPNRAPASPSDAADDRVRVFIDVDGAQWHVSERAYADYDRRRGSSLIFTSDAAVRRVRNYPATWYDLAEVELLALSWKS